MPEGELQLQEPPVLPETQNAMSGMITYIPMALGSMSMVLIFLRPGQGSTLLYIAVGLMAVSAVGMIIVGIIRGAGDRKRRMRDERRDYLRYLSRTRRQVRRAIDEQRQATAWRHPDPTTLWSIIRTSRLWERRPGHDDFGEVRIGIGPQRLGLTLAPLQTKVVEDLEPLSAHALRRFINAYGTVADQPIGAYLRAYARVLLRGTTEHDVRAVRGMVRAMVGQLMTFHAPEDLRIVIVAGPERRAEWDWAKWLPHALHPTESDGAGQMRLITDGPGRLERLLGEEFAGRGPFDPEATASRDEPYTVIVLDSAEPIPKGARIAAQGYRNCSVLDLCDALEWKAERRTVRMRVTPTTLTMVDTDPGGAETATLLGRPDFLGLGPATTLARLVSPYRIGGSAETTEPLSTDFELTSMLGIGDLFHHDVGQLWRRRGGADRLRVPLGVTADGSPMELDIKEAAQGGMGPHGMLIGATGSGKSELLRTLVLALALTHSSETLNLVLVDFKGGATFLGLDRLPHTSAMITNLADEATLVTRMKDALQGELIRRQELLRSAGSFSSALEYEAARANGAPLAPLASLFVVVDEFSELLAAHRDFMEVFVMIGRLGRSLGVHLLLASQRLDEGRTSQLESHLSYRIGLRTFSVMESRGVLGVPDAYQLPSQPGNGFLKTDVTTLTRFKAAYVSGTYRARKRATASVVAAQVVAYGTDYVAPQLPAPDASPDATPDGASDATPDGAPDATPDGAPPAPSAPSAAGGRAPDGERSLLQVAVERLVGAGPPAHPVWLPPLAVPPTLDDLLPPLAPDPERGLTTVEWAHRGTLAVPVGIVDRPFDQIRDLLTADLSGSGGHVGVAGGPQSGKSTLLRTLIASLALTHTPWEVQVYCLDFGGGGLSGLAGLPHVGGVTGRHDTERVQRTITEITSLISRRERLFAERGIDSMAAYRRLRAAAGPVGGPSSTTGGWGDAHGDVFLIVDGWSTIRQDFLDLIPTFTLIATRGLNYGVHLVIAATRWGEIGSGLRDQLGTRFELRLGDPIDSAINMRAASTVPKTPGRGLTDGRLHFLTGLPRLDGRGTTEDLAAGVANLVESIREWWDGPAAPGVRMLPARLDVANLPAPEGNLRVAIGVEETELAPFWHDFEQSPHLLVLGDAETGKTNLLRLVARAVTQRYTPDEARVALVDFRRELFDAVPEANRLGYSVSADVVRQIVDGAARAMRTRVPGPDITPERMRRRDWWTGPRLFLVVDDYELVAAANNPFEPLLDHLAQGIELGLHLIVARSANGAARGMNDPLLRRLLEANTPTLLLSCPPSEGYIIGNLKPRQLPPGRALHVTRRRTIQIQTALLPERESA